MFRNLLYLSALWPLVFLPFLHDPTPNTRGRAELAQDTTYSDGMGAYKVLAITVGGVLMPDTQDVPLTTVMSTAPNAAGDSILVMTFDTLPGLDAMDSAAVDALWSAWGYGDPQVYALYVPTKAGPPIDGPDTVGALKHTNYEQFATTQDFLDGYGTVFQFVSAQVPGERMQYLDTDVYYPGLTRSIRKEAIYQDSSDFCITRTIDHSVYLNTSTADSTIREAWFEIAVKFAPGVAGGAPHWVDCGALGMTGIFAWKAQQVACTKSVGYGRWQMTYSAGGATDTSGAEWTADAPYREYANTTDQVAFGDGNDTPWQTGLMDGEWHLLRTHIRMSTDSVTFDGIYLLYQDTLLVIPKLGVTDIDTLHRSPSLVGMYAFHSGRNKDSGGFFTTSIADLPWTEKWWIGYTTIWTAPDTPAWYREVTIPAYAQ